MRVEKKGVEDINKKLESLKRKAESKGTYGWHPFLCLPACLPLFPSYSPFYSMALFFLKILFYFILFYRFFFPLLLFLGSAGAFAIFPDFEAKVKEAEEQEAEEKRRKKEQKKDKKRQKLEETVDPEMAEMMGFGSFGSTKG
jgi:hypothetical protein